MGPDEGADGQRGLSPITDADWAVATAAGTIGTWPTTWWD